ncbi:MAG: WXG100 family type VII secretion target [Bacilli bacterium]|nr:WXG100 family type VII secretion target [Bacilli bacterium]
MNGEVYITEETMEAAANKIRQEAEEILSEFDEIKKEIAGVSETWQDENADKYIEQFNELEKQVPGFVAAANNSGAFLTGVVKAYRENVMNPTRAAVDGKPVALEE